MDKKYSVQLPIPGIELDWSYRDPLGDAANDFETLIFRGVTCSGSNSSFEATIAMIASNAVRSPKSAHFEKSSHACSAVEPRIQYRLNLSMPAELVFADNDVVSATVRDLSSTGVGFLHRNPVALRAGSIRVTTEQGECLHLPVVVEWCRPCENGLFMSGVSYV